MTLEEILATAMDLAGGEIIRQKLDAHFAVGVELNVIDTMELELAQSGRNLPALKESITLAAGTNTGTIVTGGVLGVRFLRWRLAATDRWNILDVLDSPEALTRAENQGRQAIMFAGFDKAAITYYLSFVPDAPIVVELWVRSIGANAIKGAPPRAGLEAAFLPDEFSLTAAYRVADFLLNQLLLLDGARYQGFVIAQKGSIAKEQSRSEYQWEVYRTQFSDSSSMIRAKEFNIMEDGNEEADVESFVHYRG